MRKKKLFESSSKREDLPDRIPLRLAFPWTPTAVLYSFTVDTGRSLDSFRIGLTSELRDGSIDVPFDPFDPFDPLERLHQTARLPLLYRSLFLPLTRSSTRFSTRLRVLLSYMLIKRRVVSWLDESSDTVPSLPSRPLYRLGLRSTGQGKSCDVITGCGDLRQTRTLDGYPCTSAPHPCRVSQLGRRASALLGIGALQFPPPPRSFSFRL